MTRICLSALLVFLLPLTALAQLQFDSGSSRPTPTTAPLPPGITWLQGEPMTLFDLGMMELTNSANKLAETINGVRGAVAEYQSERGIIAISFYAAQPYSREACVKLAKQLRDGLFVQRDDPARLARELSSYFISYGASSRSRPPGIGGELLNIVRVAVYSQGGACLIPLMNDEVEALQDETAPAVQAAPAAQ